LGNDVFIYLVQHAALPRWFQSIRAMGVPVPHQSVMPTKMNPPRLPDELWLRDTIDHSQYSNLFVGATWMAAVASKLNPLFGSLTNWTAIFAIR
jgi:hypothetical protein